jgi:hypothetical protein
MIRMPGRLKRIDPSSIRGPYPLFALFVLGSEGWLGYWLYRSDGGAERALVGLVMLLILGGLVYVAIRLNQSEARLVSTSGVVPSIPPPSATPATPEDLPSPPPQTIAGPDRSYLINAPPEGWGVRELTRAEWLREALGVQGSETLQTIIESADKSFLMQSRDILVLEREKRTILTPIPGRTTIDGRKVPTALGITIQTQLAIIPMERAQPPMFIERSFEHNFFASFGQILGTGTMTLKAIQAGSALQAQMEQKIERVIVDSKTDQDVVNTVELIGIPGNLNDHLLVIKHVTVAGDSEVAQDLETLKGLVASFRPVVIINPEKKREELAAMINERFKILMADKGQDIFLTEFTVLLLRLQGTNLEDPEQRLHAMKSLKAFELFTQEIDLHDEEMNKFWLALHQAEAGGDSTEFKNSLVEMIETVKTSRQEHHVGLQKLFPDLEDEPNRPIPALLEHTETL